MLCELLSMARKTHIIQRPTAWFSFKNVGELGSVID